MLAEAVPAAPLVPVFVISLFALCALIALVGLTKGLQYSLVAFLKFIAHGVRATHLPGAGWLAGHIEDGAHWLYHEIGQGVLVFEKATAWYFHNLTALARYIGHEIKGLAYDLLWLYHHVEKFTVPYWIGHVQKWVLHQLLAFAKHPIRYLRHAVAEVEHWGQALKKALAHAEAAALHAASVAGHAIAHPGAISVPWIRHEIFGLTWHQLRSLRRRLARLEAPALGILGGAIALKMLGRVAPWIRCRNVNRVGRRLCGMPAHLLDDLLALTADFFVLTNICRVIPWLNTAFDLTAAPLIAQLGRIGAGLCGAGYERGATLDVPQLHLPTSIDGQPHLL